MKRRDVHINFEKFINGLGFQGCGSLASKVILFGGLVLVGVIITIIIRRHKLGDNITFSFFSFSVTLEPNKQIRDIRKNLEETLEQFDVVNRDAKHKFKIMGYLNEVSKHSHKVFELFNRNKEEIEELFHSAIDYILPTIVHAVRDGKPGRCRIAIFVPDKTGTFLHILRGNGYSPEGQKNLKLPMDSSVAGMAYKEQRPIIIGDLSNKEALNIPFAQVPYQKDYLSLACVPIVLFNKSVGVLNIDCWEKNAFSSEDKAYLQYFANQMALLVTAYKLRVEGWDEQVDEVASEEEK